MATNRQKKNVLEANVKYDKKGSFSVGYTTTSERVALISIIICAIGLAGYFYSKSHESSDPSQKKVQDSNKEVPAKTVQIALPEIKQVSTGEESTNSIESDDLIINVDQHSSGKKSRNLVNGKTK